MSEIADRYRRLCGAFVDKVSQVSPERWASRSPCEDWAARDVVAHLVEVQGIFLGLVNRPFERTVNVEDDPVGALREAFAQVQDDLEDPERAGTVFVGYFGPMSFEDAIDRFICFDLAIHGWDLARATGLDETIDPADVVRLRAAVDGFGDALHQSGVCGPPVDVATDADDQTRLLALLGRHV